MASKPVPEQIADAIEESAYPELSIREVMERAGLSKGQVSGAAGSMDRLELDRSLGVVRLRDDDGGEFADDHGQDALPDGGVPTETHVDPDDGLWIPAAFREFDTQVVIRTPKSTIQHFNSEPLDGYYGLVTERDFGPVEDIRDPKNPDLAPDQVSIKPQGEDAVTLDVEVHPEVRADGGHGPTIYLAGPVAAYQDGGAAWRDRLVEEFGDEFAFRNPLDKYNVPVEDLTIVDGSTPSADGCVSVTELVEGDKDLLRESDAVLVGYSDVQSIGTPMEVMWAYERDIPVAVWLRDATDYDQLSPWYRYHAGAVVDEPEDALHYLWGNVPAPAREVRY